MFAIDCEIDLVQNNFLFLFWISKADINKLNLAKESFRYDGIVF